MDQDSQQLLAEALKRVELHESFSPAEIGHRIGLSKHRSEAAARWLSNAGILEIGFDFAANFSPDFKKANVVEPKKPNSRRKKQPSSKA